MPYKLNPFTGKFDFYESAASLGAVLQFTTDDANTITPDGSGNVNVNGIVVSNGTNATPLFTDGATANTARFELQVGSAITGAPANANDAGIVSFDDTQFTVDANGFVQLIGGGVAVDEINVDFSTAPGTDPVVPTSGGALTFSGNIVANATNTNAPVATHSRTANSLTIEVQLSTALGSAPADSFDAGLSSFSNTYFSVDSNGYVQIIGDLAALEALAGVGFPSRIAANTWVQRTITGATDGSIDVTNGNGVSGAPIISLNDRVRNQGIYFENIGCTYAAGTGTFTIHSSDGTAFSSSNPGYIVLPSRSSPGTFVTYSVTSNQNFIDDNGASEIIGNLFGLTTGVAYAQDLPFYIYAVTNDAETAIQFMISRVPNRTTSPASANIGTPASAVADTQGSFFSFDSITTTDYDSNPCACIGSFRMQMSALDDWTVQTLDNADGIGQYQEDREFTVAIGTFGASASSYLLPNGGTAPLFSTNTYVFKIAKNGKYNAYVRLDGDAGTDGAGAVTTLLINPYVQDSTLNNVYLGSGIISAPGIISLQHSQIQSTGTLAFVYQSTIVTTLTAVTHAIFTNGNRTITGTHEFYVSIA